MSYFELKKTGTKGVINLEKVDPSIVNDTSDRIYEDEDKIVIKTGLKLYIIYIATSKNKIYYIEEPDISINNLKRSFIRVSEGPYEYFLDTQKYDILRPDELPECLNSCLSINAEGLVYRNKRVENRSSRIIGTYKGVVYENQVCSILDASGNIITKGIDGEAYCINKGRYIYMSEHFDLTHWLFDGVSGKKIDMTKNTVGYKDLHLPYIFNPSGFIFVLPEEGKYKRFTGIPPVCEKIYNEKGENVKDEIVNCFRKKTGVGENSFGKSLYLYYSYFENTGYFLIEVLLGAKGLFDKNGDIILFLENGSKLSYSDKKKQFYTKSFFGKRKYVDNDIYSI